MSLFGYRVVSPSCQNRNYDNTRAVGVKTEIYLSVRSNFYIEVLCELGGVSVQFYWESGNYYIDENYHS